MKNQANYSKLIAGAMTWGSWGKQFSTMQMSKLMHHCLELGISSFDHADIYGGYTTEADFGKAFKESKINREQIQLISKCGIQLSSEKRPLVVNHYDYSKQHILDSVEHSLRNLKTDYLDLLLLHRPSPLMHPEIITEAIGKLQAAGKILNFGVSNFSSAQIQLLEKEIPVKANQLEISLTSNKVMYDGTLDDAISNHRMVMAWSPLGTFFREQSDQTKRIRKALEPMMAKYNTSEDVLLLAWLLKHPANIYPVLGTTTSSRWSNAIKALEIELEETDWFILLEASNGHPVP